MAQKKKGTASQADKSVEAFRDALERSVTISRERIQEVVDEAVKRGRMTRGDANEMVSKLVARGRKQTEDLVADLEKLAGQARQDLDEKVKAATGAADQLRRTVKSAAPTGSKPAAAPKAAPKARKATPKARKAAPKSSSGASFPIAGYDKLNVAEVKKKLTGLSAANLKKVRTKESSGKGRKGILAEIDKKLG